MNNIQYPCNIDYIKNKIKDLGEKKTSIEHVMDGNDDLCIQLNSHNILERIEQDIAILYDYAYLRFGVNLKLMSWD